LHKIDVYLKKSNLSSETKSNISFSHAEFSKSSKILELYFNLNKVFDIHILKNISNQIKSYYIEEMENLEVYYIQREKVKKDQILNYLETIVHDFSKKRPSASVLKNFECEVKDDKITYFIDSDSKFIEQHFNSLENEFLRFGIDLKISFKVLEEIPRTTLMVEHEKKEIDAVYEQKRTLELNKKINFSKSLIVKKSKNKMNINEIPSNRVELDNYLNNIGNSQCVLEGEVTTLEIRDLRNGSKLLILTISDLDDSIIVKKFINNEREYGFSKSIEIGNSLQVTGNFNFDSYQREVVVMARSIKFLDVKKAIRKDTAKTKRVEFHIHSTMSNLDGIEKISEYVKTVSEWGHNALALTDHDGVYGFPEFEKATKKYNIKPIYGSELSVVNCKDFKVIKDVAEGLKLIDLTYTVFDIETTGLSASYNKIIEIAALKIKNGVILERFQEFINPNEKLSDFTIKLTSITDDMLKGKAESEEVLKKFMLFVEGTVLVAHNADFDSGFIEKKMQKFGIKKTYFGVIDTLQISRILYNEKLKRFNLKSLARHFKIQQESHHRAEDDTRVTTELWILMLQDLHSQGYKNTSDLIKLNDHEDAYKFLIPHHMNVLVSEQKGLKNLYEIVSESLTSNYFKGARNLRKFLDLKREGLLFGSGCYRGEVFQTALNKGQDKLKKIISYYDYVEIQPLGFYEHIIEQYSKDTVLRTLRSIINVAKEMNVLIIASSDAHYISENDKFYRDIYIRTPQVGGGLHDLKRYNKVPTQNLLTTNEMLEEIKEIDSDYENIVIHNTVKLASKIDSINLLPTGLLTIKDDAFKENLEIQSIEKELKMIVENELKNKYGTNPHPIVLDRVHGELKKIISNKFAPIYYVSHLLVKKSLSDGYLVGSRGSVGSSLIATLMSITEVNPLKPHYVCPECFYTAFHIKGELYSKYGFQKQEKDLQIYFDNVYCGFDLPNLNCPICSVPLLKEGHDIPFETFLGFDGDKIPDIDLNFSGEYQSKAHNYIRNLVGKSQTFRAGTIQTIAERNAYGYVKGYLEDHNINLRNAQVSRIAKKLEGVKRSTGQHPGGIIVVPEGHNIHEITPIQYPANNTNSEWYTTHFDYHAFEDNLLKLDILGHDDPTMIKYLMDYVNKNPEKFPFDNAKNIPLDDPKVIKMFSETAVLGIDKKELMSDIASFAIPEFNTNFTRQMLSDIKPNTFAELVKVSGLSHGTNVYLSNSQDLIKGSTSYGKIEVKNIIGCRDDIMVQLISFGLEKSKAFEIMEFVRRGNPSKKPDEWLNYESEMRLSGVPDWYIWSCQKIKYMFPKSHATAYVMMALRIAWFKIHHPLLFYSAYFSKRAEKFDYERMLAGPQAIKNKIKSLQMEPRLTQKDENVLTTMLVAYEFVLRGFKFKKVHISKSDSSVFLMEDNSLRMPFTSIDGLGLSVANDILEKRKEKPFETKDEIKSRTKINQTIFELLNSYGAFDELKDKKTISNQGLFAL